ncbi:unnamed protein product [Ectocarpus sp. 12 AP-2014]
MRKERGRGTSLSGSCSRACSWGRGRPRGLRVQRHFSRVQVEGRGLRETGAGGDPDLPQPRQSGGGARPAGSRRRGRPRSFPGHRGRCGNLAGGCGLLSRRGRRKRRKSAGCPHAAPAQDGGVRGSQRPRQVCFDGVQRGGHAQAPGGVPGGDRQQQGYPVRAEAQGEAQRRHAPGPGPDFYAFHFDGHGARGKSGGLYVRLRLVGLSLPAPLRGGDQGVPLHAGTGEGPVSFAARPAGPVSR